MGQVLDPPSLWSPSSTSEIPRNLSQQRLQLAVVEKIWAASEEGDHRGVTSLLQESSGLSGSRRMIVSTSTSRRKGSTPAHAAAAQGHTAVLLALCRGGLSCDTPRLSSDRFTPLIVAINSPRSDSGTVAALLRMGANVDHVDTLGCPALFHAAKALRADYCELLLDAGAAPDASTHAGTTALMAASELGNVSVVKLLLGMGAAVDAKSNNGCTALFSASERGHVPVLELLIDAGASVDSQRRGGQTPLMAAAGE